MKNIVHLIPFEVEEVLDKSDEVPVNIQTIEAPERWETSEKGSAIVIAVLDTGCDTTHIDLKDRIIGSKNFTDEGGETDVGDQNGHGTHVSGTIAASLNGTGVVGVAPEANLLILKVLTGNGSGNYEWITDAIDYAIKWRGPDGQRVRVISMSLGGPSDVPSLHEKIKQAVSAGIMIVCAAGNSGDGRTDTPEQSYPGYYNEVVQIGAVDEDNRIASFTNTNDQLDLVAPGVNILSTYKDGGYARLSGTSMATPHASGAVAIILNEMEKRFGRTLTEAEMYAQLCKRTMSLGYRASAEGNGLLMLHTPMELLIKDTAELKTV